MEETGQGQPPPDPNQLGNSSVDPVYPPPTQPGYPSEYPQGQIQPLQLPGTGYSPDYQHQQEGYPLSYPTQPQSFGYPSNQGYYSDQNKDTPPPYYLPPPQQEKTTGVVVVQQQPTVYTAIAYTRIGDHCMTFSIVVCIVCCLFGSPLTLCCSIPALNAALQAKDAERHGNNEYAADQDRKTISLNILTIIFGFIFFVVYTIVPISVGGS